VQCAELATRRGDRLRHLRLVGDIGRGEHAARAEFGGKFCAGAGVNVAYHRVAGCRRELAGGRRPQARGAAGDEEGVAGYLHCR